MHLVMFPDSFEDSSICPLVLAIPMDIILVERAFVIRVVCPDKQPFAMLLSVHV